MAGMMGILYTRNGCMIEEGGAGGWSQRVELEGGVGEWRRVESEKVGPSRGWSRKVEYEGGVRGWSRRVVSEGGVEDGVGEWRVE